MRSSAATATSQPLALSAREASPNTSPSSSIPRSRRLDAAPDLGVLVGGVEHEQRYVVAALDELVREVDREELAASRGEGEDADQDVPPRARRVEHGVEIERAVEIRGRVSREMPEVML